MTNRPIRIDIDQTGTSRAHIAPGFPEIVRRRLVPIQPDRGKPRLLPGVARAAHVGEVQAEAGLDALFFEPFESGPEIRMATDVPARVRQLKGRGAVPEWAAYLILESGLTYEEANEREGPCEPTADSSARERRTAATRAVPPGACTGSTGRALSGGIS